MDVLKCVICGADITKGQICPKCKKKYKPPAEIIDALFRELPVTYRGTNYGCISALIFRTRSAARIRKKERCTVQIELMSGRTNSVVIADPKEVTVLKGWLLNEQSNKKRD